MYNIQNFKLLVFCDCTVWFVSDVAGHKKTRFLGWQFSTQENDKNSYEYWLVIYMACDAYNRDFSEAFLILAISWENNVIFEQVQHKPSCTSTEDS